MSDDTPTLQNLMTVGLSHEDRFVRNSCLRYWKKQPGRGSAQAKRIIASLKAYGMQAFPYPQQAYDIPLDRSSFEYLIETLREAPCFDDKDLEYFGRWFKWCLSVENEILPELEAFLQSEQALVFEGNGFVGTRELLERIESMRRHESLDGAACRSGIDQALASIESADEFPHEAVAEVKSLLHQLVRFEAPESLAEFATSWLALDPTIDQDAVEPDDNDWLDDFRFGFGVYLAGEIGLTSAIDRILDGVSQTDWDWLNETSAAALLKMPPAEPTARLRERWWQLPEHGRLFFSDAFVIAHLPEHRDFYLENMRRADDFDFEIVPHRMARALALLGDANSLKEVADYWEANAYDPEATEVAETLYAIHRLRDEEPPMLEAVRDHLLHEEAHYLAAQERLAKLNAAWERKRRADQVQSPVVRKQPKIGRNDFCPCGSGKKYKKCCLNKEETKGFDVGATSAVLLLSAPLGLFVLSCCCEPPVHSRRRTVWPLPYF